MHLTFTGPNHFLMMIQFVICQSSVISSTLSLSFSSTHHMLLDAWSIKKVCRSEVKTSHFAGCYVVQLAPGSGPALVVVGCVTALPDDIFQCHFSQK